MPPVDPEALPEWEDGTVAILSTAAGSPHAIPVSTGVRAGPRCVLLALALRRETLARLRADPRAALTIITAGVAVTAHCRAEVVEDPMDAADGVAALALHVEAVQDHDAPRFVIEAGVRWRWTEEAARTRDAEIRAALYRLAAGGR